MIAIIALLNFEAVKMRIITFNVLCVGAVVTTFLNLTTPPCISSLLKPRYDQNLGVMRILRLLSKISINLLYIVKRNRKLKKKQNYIWSKTLNIR